MNHFAKIAIFLILIIIAPCIVFGEEIPIQVDGYSNDQYDGTQIDRAEAILDAKIQAIERAGVKIRSETTVNNFTVMKDLIEAKADAILMPGFYIVDIGYDAKRNYYKVTLIGRIKVSSDFISTSLKPSNHDITGVSIVEYKCNDCLVKIMAESIGVYGDVDEINAKIMAEKEAMGKIKKKIIDILSAEPYNFDINYSAQVYEKGNLKEIDYEKSNKEVRARVKYIVKVPAPVK